MEWQGWIATIGGAVGGLSAALVLLRGYLRTPAMLPAKDSAVLRQSLDDCRNECASLRDQLRDVRGELKDVKMALQDELKDVKTALQMAKMRIEELMRELEWWRERWRRAEAQLDRSKTSSGE